MATLTENVRGIVLWDVDNDSLLIEKEWIVIHNGRERILKLRVGRGSIRDRDE